MSNPTAQPTAKPQAHGSCRAALFTMRLFTMRLFTMRLCSPCDCVHHATVHHATVHHATVHHATRIIPTGWKLSFNSSSSHRAAQQAPTAREAAANEVCHGHTCSKRRWCASWGRASTPSNMH